MMTSPTTPLFPLVAALLVAVVTPAVHALEVGEPAPPLVLEDLLQAPDGTDVSWDALRGQPVVLEFWHTECGPCISALPHLNELAAEMRGEDIPLQFIAITHEDRSVLEPFLAEHPIDGWIGIDTDRSVREAYGVRGVPRTILVDGEGIVAGILHPDRLRSVYLRRLAWGQELELPVQEKHVSISPGLDRGEEGEISECFELRDAVAAGSGTTGSSSAYGPDRASFFNVDATDLVSWVYDHRKSRVEWVVDEPDGRYDLIVAKPDDEDGFLTWSEERLCRELGVELRVETRQVPVYVMTLSPDRAERLVPTEEQHSSTASIAPDRVQFTNRHLVALAVSLENWLGMPVLDETGLEGGFDFDLRWNQSRPRSILPKLRNEYGIMLTREKRDVDYLIVDRPD